ncbi:response regulator [Allomuricauda sp.]|uniref:response regulator n=1 Tax=Flagellimonas alginolytica TaxID=3177515 RepID=UPI0025CBD1AD|nr:response regulator [Allomuricauda sp.]
MKKSSILLVDDDEIYLFVTKKLLNSLSNDLIVNSFTDGEQALEYVHVCLSENVNLPEIILLDINMPYLDGWGFLSEFKKIKPKLEDQKVKIFMVTSSNSEEDIKKAKEFEEITGYVVKPIYEDKLKDILTEVFNTSLE